MNWKFWEKKPEPVPEPEVPLQGDPEPLFSTSHEVGGLMPELWEEPAPELPPVDPEPPREQIDGHPQAIAAVRTEYESHPGKCTQWFVVDGGYTLAWHVLDGQELVASGNLRYPGYLWDAQEWRWRWNGLE